MAPARQDELFPDLIRPKPDSLAVGKQAQRVLTKGQKRFQKELRLVEQLRDEYERTVALWNRFLDDYRRDIHPAEQRRIRERNAVIRKLLPYWESKTGLGRRQREDLMEILRTLIAQAFAEDPDMGRKEPWLEALRESLVKIELEQVAKDQADVNRDILNLSPEELEESRAVFGEIVAEFGFDPDAFTPEMTPEEISREMERQMRDGGGPTRISQGTGARPGSAAAARSKKEVEREEAKQRTLASIYRGLAKELHPDLEPDPERRVRKQQVMQELTTAYREKDLHTLLRLELEWLEGEDSGLQTLAEEKIAIYVEVLKEQVASLRESIAEVPMEPRFAAVGQYAMPLGNKPFVASGILAMIETQCDQMHEVSERLGGPDSKQTLRDLIASIRSQRRRQPFD